MELNLLRPVYYELRIYILSSSTISLLAHRVYEKQ